MSIPRVPKRVNGWMISTLILIGVSVTASLWLVLGTVFTPHQWSVFEPTEAESCSLPDGHRLIAISLTQFTNLDYAPWVQGIDLDGRGDALRSGIFPAGTTLREDALNGVESGNRVGFSINEPLVLVAELPSRPGDLRVVWSAGEVVSTQYFPILPPAGRCR